MKNKLTHLVGTSNEIKKNFTLSPEPQDSSYSSKKNTCIDIINSMKSPFFKACFIVCVENAKDKDIRRIGHSTAENLPKLPNMRKVNICYEEIRVWVAQSKSKELLAHMAQCIIEEGENIFNYLRLLNGVVKIFSEKGLRVDIDRLPDISLNVGQKVIVMDTRDIIYL